MRRAYLPFLNPTADGTFSFVSGFNVFLIDAHKFAKIQQKSLALKKTKVSI